MDGPARPRYATAMQAAKPQRILGVLVTLLVAILLLFWLTADDPAVAQAQAGMAGASLVARTVSDGPFGGHATVRLQPPGNAGEPNEIKMTRPFWSRHWRMIPAGP